MCKHALTVASAFAILVAALPAEDKPEDPSKRAAITQQEAGPDYAIQGEYEGEHQTDEGKKRIGVQVVALGEGKFHAVAYPGGLPGAGFSGDEKIEADGTLADGKAVFETDKGRGVVADGKLSIQNLDGDALGTLEKTVRKSPTLGKKPPKDAVVLFDGSSAENFQGGKLTEDGLLQPGATSKQKFQDFTLHVEFLLSFMPQAQGQARSNSGVYMQGRYEVQILDSFGLEGKHNECGGIYSVKDPDVNMCLPPLQWQTYDIDFTAARYDESGKKLKNARMTVKHNGVVIHHDVEVPKATTAAPVQEGPEPGPIYIQDHGNPLRFRNIWLLPRTDAAAE
ncbi:MAG: DUF1080 domain-containing protein [Planctomycetes bacterium]|nr:DUF1080 domain-containing protein [Planctomycetota bacterium]